MRDDRQADRVKGHSMSHQPQDVLVGAYQDLEAAKRDFDAVTALVKARKVKVEGVILVEHHEDGEVSVVSTGDHMGRHGLGWGAGVGLVVGLLQPRAAAAVAVGAVGGGVIGKFADHRLKSEPRREDRRGAAARPRRHHRGRPHARTGSRSSRRCRARRPSRSCRPTRAACCGR